jgi:hypothetical protein
VKLSRRFESSRLRKIDESAGDLAETDGAYRKRSDYLCFVRPQSAGLRRASPRGVARLCYTLVFVIAACACMGDGGPTAPEDIFLPRLTGAPPHYPAAAIEGTLVEGRGCLELKNLYLSAEFASPSPHAVVLLLWPEGSSATRTADGGLRVDAPDLPVASTGQRLFVGGMFASREDAEQKVGEPIPADCRVGLYWVATPLRT